MFPYLEACRTAGALELDLGDVLGFESNGPAERPRSGPPGSGRHCIVVSLQRAWNGHASKVVVSLMSDTPAAA
jgi:hypothetical protein